MFATQRTTRARLTVVALLTAAISCLGLSACSSSSSSKSGNSGVPAKKTLTVAVQLSYPPYQYVENGKVVGFEVDLVEEVLKRLGYQTRWENIPFDTMFTAVSGGKVDMAASTINGWAPKNSLVYSVITKREQIVSLTRPIYLVKYLLVANRQKDPGLTSVDQMKSGMSVAVVQGSTEFQYAQKYLAPRGVTVTTVTGGAQAFTAVDSGKADATFAEAGAVHAAAQQEKNLNAGEPIGELQAGYAWALPKNEPKFFDEINKTIGEVIDDGTYAKLYAKYFDGATPPSNLPALPFSASS